MDQYAYASRPEGADFAVQKQKIIDSLTDFYSKDVIDADEYERRLERVQAAFSMQDLDGIIPDLSRKDEREVSSGSGATEPRHWTDASDETQGGTRHETRTQPETAFCLMSGRNISGNRLSKGAQVFALMGGVDLDFRNTKLPPGETKVDVFAMMGGVEITVPPGLAVHSEVIAIMGGSDIKRNVKSDPYPGEPYLTISGLVLMGGVDVKAK